ncbi:cation efflux family protein [Penicillium mononematosum]|uniref:cation efflux family protein n=1 Tax=Penicillium mononematosum TaxID=268346 RepID=UPI0025482F68|nr:cation efflux family protein [Penicillium mononematosum]KAJ6187263.1 cation efflux family protein [Penicillium mononematosum]
MGTMDEKCGSQSDPPYTHDEARKRTLDSNNHSDAGTRIAQIGLAANMTMAIGKLIGGYILHSQALVADAYHGFMDSVLDALTLVTITWSLWPASRRFPNGYGKIENIGAFVVSGLLLLGGILTCLESSKVLLSEIRARQDWQTHGTQASGTNLNAAWLAAGSIFVKEWLYRATNKVAIEQGSSVLASHAIHHRIDSLTSFVALIAIGGGRLFRDIFWIDAAGGLLISLMVIHAGWSNLLNSFLELADITIDSDVTSSISEAAANRVRSMTGSDIVKIRTVHGIKSGRNYLIDLELAVPGAWPVSRTYQIEGIVRGAIGTVTSNVKQVKVRFVPLQDNELGSQAS